MRFGIKVAEVPVVAAVIVAVGISAGCGTSSPSKPVPTPTAPVSSTAANVVDLTQNQTAALGTLGHAATLSAGVGITFTLTTTATGLALTADYDTSILKLVDQPAPGRFRFTTLAPGTAEVKVTAPVPGDPAAIIGDVTVLVKS